LISPPLCSGRIIPPFPPKFSSYGFRLPGRPFPRGIRVVHFLSSLSLALFPPPVRSPMLEVVIRFLLRGGRWRTHLFPPSFIHRILGPVLVLFQSPVHPFVKPPDFRSTFLPIYYWEAPSTVFQGCQSSFPPFPLVMWGGSSGREPTGGVPRANRARAVRTRSLCAHLISLRVGRFEKLP